MLLRHLLENALKYADIDAPQIRVHAQALDDRVAFELADNGPGIPDGQRARALRLFQRLHSGDIPGVGAGLALCRRIVESGGGRLLIETAPEGGALIRFTLPSAAAPQPNQSGS
jgi:two-component system, OmpR family, sensor histidine kinase KdpD